MAKKGKKESRSFQGALQPLGFSNGTGERKEGGETRRAGHFVGGFTIRGSLSCRIKRGGGGKT